MLNYLFVDNETGEEFFVQEHDYTRALRIAQENFEDPEYMGETYTDEEAEELGLDTY